MERKPLRIAIIGGGIGGLCFALSLAKSIPDHASRFVVDIYESTSSLEGQVGAGIALYAYTWGILEHLGLDKELIKYTTSIISDGPLPFFKVRKSDQPQGQDLFTLQSEVGGVVLFHRGDLQSVLLRNIPSSFRIHTKKRLSTYSQSPDEVLLQFEDGSTATCDLVVGADGLQSNVRRTMLEEVLQVKLSDNPATSKEEYLKRLCTPYWTGSIIYRGLIPAQKLKDAGWGHHRVLTGDLLNVGRDGSIITYLVAGGTMVNFAALKSWPHLDGSVYSDQVVDELLGHTDPRDNTKEKELNEELGSAHVAAHNDRDPWAENGGGGMTSKGRARWVHRVDNEEVRSAYKDWEEEMQVLIDNIGTPLQWAIHANHPLPTFRHGRACVLGDAAHAMPPFLGQGSGQAISDGLVLAKLVAGMAEDKLCDPTSQVDALLYAYDAIRRPISQKMVELSQYHGNHWFLRTKDAEGQVFDVDTNNKEHVDALRESMTRNWSVCWDKRTPFEEAEKAINLFKQRVFDQAQPQPQAYL